MITHLLPMLQESSSAAMEYSGSTSLGTGPTLFAIAIIVFLIVSIWKLHTKAGQPGWAVFVPIYNAIVWLRICGKPGWWVLLLIIPVVNLI
ncbi:MAG: DUF5684 domain-containing protein, partial [Verrucomicrobia bacterium]|nr:DUF5684 domain-containing protein [Verrucomicrobiota bacterium]